MFRSTIEEAEKAWFYYEPLTLLHTYEELLELIVDVYAPYRYIVERYSKKVNRKVHPVTEEYLEENPEVANQNVALLKNAMELWRVASRTSDAVAPMLYQYSWHCFNSFFAYTFFRWEPQHARSHGIRISRWSDNIEEIKIQFLKQGGLFQRLIDTWTLLGTSLAFSPFLPIFQNDEIRFIPNPYYLLNNSSYLSVKQLLAFNSGDYERALHSDLRKKLINCPVLQNSISAPTDDLKNYLITFVASSLARYRPILWNSVLTGKNAIQSNFALHFRGALMDYTSGAHVHGFGLLYQISQLLRGIARRKFEFRKRA